MNSTTKITSMSFNPQQDCFTFGCDQGLRVFNSHPPILIRSLNRDLIGSVKLCTILHRSNLLIFVGAGSNSKFPSNVVFVWDDKRQELILELTVKGGPIVNILVEHARLIVVQEKKLNIFSFPNPCKLIRIEDMRPNPTGLVAMSGNKDCQMLVYPGFKLGSIQLMNLKTLTESSSLAPNTIDAHVNEIVQLTINIDGTLVATGSSQGTVIRVFNTRTHDILIECRRGADPSTLHCLQFSPCSSYLAVSSDKVRHPYNCFDYRNNSMNDRRISRILKIANEIKMPVNRITHAQLDVITEFQLHNGVCLDTSPLPFSSPSLCNFSVYLDGILDTGNIGAIARSCLFFGVQQLIYTQAKGPSFITSSMSKASAGAIERLPIVRFNHQEELFSLFSDAYIVGTSDWSNSSRYGAECIEVEEFVVVKDKPVVLVLGDEGLGISQSLMARCNSFVCIRGTSDNIGHVNSLNVSVAAGILFQKISRTIMK